MSSENQDTNPANRPFGSMPTNNFNHFDSNDYDDGEVSDYAGGMGSEDEDENKENSWQGMIEDPADAELPPSPGTGTGPGRGRPLHTFTSFDELFIPLPQLEPPSHFGDNPFYYVYPTPYPYSYPPPYPYYGPMGFGYGPTLPLMPMYIDGEILPADTHNDGRVRDASSSLSATPAPAPVSTQPEANPNPNYPYEYSTGSSRPTSSTSRTAEPVGTAFNMVESGNTSASAFDTQTNQPGSQFLTQPKTMPTASTAKRSKIKNNSSTRPRGWAGRLVAASPLWVGYLIVGGLLLALLTFAGIFLFLISTLFMSSSSNSNNNNGSGNGSRNSSSNSTPALQVAVLVKLKTQEGTTVRLDTQMALASGSVQPFEFDMVVDGTHPATGHTLLPDAKAGGPVRVFNPSAVAVTLPAGTVMAQLTASNGVVYHYLLTQSLTVPATEITSLRIGSSDARVEADLGGQAGNVPGGFGRLTLGRGLQMAGLGPVEGGSDRAVTVATKQDLAELLTSLQAQSGSAVAAKLKVLQPATATATAQTFSTPTEAAVLNGTASGISNGGSTALPNFTQTATVTSRANNTEIQLPQGFMFLSDLPYVVTNSVFTPGLKEGQEVFSMEGQSQPVVQGKLLLHVKTLIYQSAALTAWTNSSSMQSATLTTPNNTGYPNSMPWQLVGVRSVSAPAAGDKASGGNTGGGGGQLPAQFEVQLQRPVNQTQVKAQLEAAYRNFVFSPVSSNAGGVSVPTTTTTTTLNNSSSTTTPINNPSSSLQLQLNRVVEDLQSRNDVASVQLELSSALHIALGDTGLQPSTAQANLTANTAASNLNVRDIKLVMKFID